MNSWEENVKKVTPYVPGEQPKGDDIIKLNTNENPYPPSPMVEKAIREFDCGSLRKYPDPDVTDLRKAIAKYHSVGLDNVFVGVGSDDVLSTAFLTFFNSTKPIFIADITYSFYEVWANVYKIPYKTIPVRDDMVLNKAAFGARNGGIVIANPNAPTGLSLHLDYIEQTIFLNPDVVVIIDEAYADFDNQTALGLIGKYENLLVVRTFSKSRSMAGNRIGYAIGSKKLISYLMAVRNSINSYTIDSVTAAAGIASINDDKYFKKTVSEIIKTREWTGEQLKELGFTFPESSANFIFAKHEKEKGEELFKELRRRNIYVRYFKKPRIEDYLRITIGTKEEMEALMYNLKDML